ncbi:hypothetical protein [Burkholderia stagnalis]|uniref:hypothetical protein n=1 Tax=Burkholderia stagnalis TaxID=1503054 RepID=UPI0018C76B37|nr:hypothetical protein [Burkholderia stagnalis]
MGSVYSIPKLCERETIEIQRVLRASNAENMARRRVQDEIERRQMQIKHCGRDLRLVAQ